MKKIIIFLAFLFLMPHYAYAGVNKENIMSYQAYQTNLVKENASFEQEAIFPKKLATSFDNNDIRFCHDKNVKKALKLIGYLLIIVKIAVPCLLIVFGVIDFAKVVMSSSDDSIKKSTNTLFVRFIAAIIIFILPTVINFVFEKIVKNNSNYTQCRICVFNPKKC